MKLDEAVELLTQHGYNLTAPKQIDKVTGNVMLNELALSDLDLQKEDANIISLVEDGFRNAAKSQSIHVTVHDMIYQAGDPWDQDLTHGKAKENIDTGDIVNGKLFGIRLAYPSNGTGIDGRFAVLLNKGNDWYTLVSTSTDVNRRNTTDKRDCMEKFAAGEIGWRVNRLTQKPEPFLPVLTRYWLKPDHPDTALLAKLYPSLGITVANNSPFKNLSIKQLWDMWDKWRRSKKTSLEAEFNSKKPKAVDAAAEYLRKQNSSRDQAIKANLKKFLR